MSSSLLWYDIFFDALVFEFHHYLTLILFGELPYRLRCPVCACSDHLWAPAGVVVEYPFGGTALQVVERLGYEEQVRILIGRCAGNSQACTGIQMTRLRNAFRGTVRQPGNWGGSLLIC